MSVRILIGDARERLLTLPDKSIQTVVTSPPYFGLRDYGTGTWEGGDLTCEHVVKVVRTGAGMEALGARYRGGGKKATKVKKIRASKTCPKCGARRMDDKQLGLESTPEDYVRELVELFRVVREKLRDDGTVWLNIGDTYAATGGVGSGGGAVLRIGRGHQQRNVRGGRRFAGIKPKDLIGIPWMLAFALRADGWYLRQEVIWSKPNPMPESVEDRCTNSQEKLFLLSKSGRPTIWRARDDGAWSHKPDHSETIPNPSKNPKYVARRPRVRRWRAFDYYFDADAIAEEAIWQPGSREDVLKGGFSGKGTVPGGGQQSFRAIRETRNKRSVWEVATVPFPEAHFATYPPKLIEPCILASTPPDGVVLDPFGGAGTTAIVATGLGRDCILCELSPTYVDMTVARLRARDSLLLEIHLEPPPQKEAA